MGDTVIFKGSNAMLFICIFISISFVLMYFWTVNVIILKFGIAFILISCLILPFSVKTLKIEENSIIMLYHFRPFFKLYRYRSNNIKKVLCDCGIGSADIYIKVERNTPFFIFKYKYLLFQCRNDVQAKDIIYLLKTNGVKIKFRGNRDKQKFIKKEIGVI